MNAGRYVLSQIQDLIHWQTLTRLAAKYEPDSKHRHFGFRQQFICAVFAQMTSRDGLRDIVACLNARPATLYHLGFTDPLARSTMLLRRVRYLDSETSKELTFLTNNLEIPALTVAMLYKLRWRIELFFRWIKGHLRIKHYYGTSPNAVKTQISIAVCTYLMIAILHKQLKLPGTLHRTLQVLSIHPFDKVPLNELLTETDHGTLINLDPNQLNLF